MWLQQLGLPRDYRETSPTVSLATIRQHAKGQFTAQSRGKRESWESIKVLPAEDRQNSLNQREAFAEIDAFDLKIAAQFARSSRAEDTPLIDDVGAVGDRQGLADVVVRDQNSDA